MADGKEPEERVIAAPQVLFNYVLILEWLGEGDRRTGAELHDYLTRLRLRSTLVVCATAADVQAALAEALQNVEAHGIPVVHIESHGDDPDAAQVHALAFGSGVEHGITWRDLGSWLGPLNAASGFALLVVGATCHGLAVLAAMTVDGRVAPFAACVGFTTKAVEASVADAMCELYRSIAKGLPLHQAIQSAAREVRDVGEKLECEAVTKIAYQVLRGARDRTNPQTYEQVGRFGLQRQWDRWFPVDIQEGKPEYRLDWSLIEL